MAWKLDDSRSIHSQLTAVIRGRIISGYYPPGSRLSSVRELADEAGVNPNTMQRALSMLESTGVIFSQRTSGRFVTSDTDKISALRHEAAMDAVRRFVGEMKELGVSPAEAEEMLKEFDSPEDPGNGEDSKDSEVEV